MWIGHEVYKITQIKSTWNWCNFYWSLFSSQRWIKGKCKHSAFTAKKIWFHLTAAHGRCKGVNSNQAIMRVQRAGFFPNKTNPVTIFQAIRSPPIPPKSSNCSDGALQISDGDLQYRMSVLKKESTSPDLYQTSQRVVSRGELGPSLTRTTAWGREQQQQLSIDVNIEPTPSRKDKRLFSPH